jgi:hypothetical protein
VPGTAKINGHGYPELQRAWWKWRLRQHGKHPSVGQGHCLTAAQTGPVWFLSGVPVHGRIACTVPHGRYLMFGGPAVDCSTAEKPPFRGHTDRGLITCAHRDFSSFFEYFALSIDGRPLNPSGYTFATGVFDVTMPDTDTYLGVSDHTHVRIAVYGSATIVTALSPGQHTITDNWRYSGQHTTKDTWTITAA